MGAVGVPWRTSEERSGCRSSKGALGVFWGQMKSREGAVAHLGCPLLSKCAKEARTYPDGVPSCRDSKISL